MVGVVAWYLGLVPATATSLLIASHPQPTAQGQTMISHQWQRSYLKAHRSSSSCWLLARLVFQLTPFGQDVLITHYSNFVNSHTLLIYKLSRTLTILLSIILTIHQVVVLDESWFWPLTLFLCQCLIPVIFFIANLHQSKPAQYRQRCGPMTRLVFSLSLGQARSRERLGDH